MHLLTSKAIDMDWNLRAVFSPPPSPSPSALLAEIEKEEERERSLLNARLLSSLSRLQHSRTPSPAIEHGEEGSGAAAASEPPTTQPAAPDVQVDSSSFILPFAFRSLCLFSASHLGANAACDQARRDLCGGQSLARRSGMEDSRGSGCALYLSRFFSCCTGW